MRIAENADGTGASSAYLATFYYNPDGSPESTLRGMTSPTSDYAYTVYGHDAIGRVSSITDQYSDTPASNVLTTFGWNPASGLGSITGNNDSYAWTGHYQVNRGYTTNGLNQYSGAGGASFAYDANGNLISDGTRTYVYDVENRLVAASGGVTLAYDPLGRLNEVTGGSGTTRFLYDGDALVAEYNLSGTLQHRYVHGPNAGADDPMVWYDGASVNQAARRYLIPNHQGSIVAVANGYGATTAINRYDEYGIPAGSDHTDPVGPLRLWSLGWFGRIGLPEIIHGWR